MNISKLIMAALVAILLVIQGAAAAEPKDEPVKAGGFFSEMDGAIRQFANKADQDLAKSMTAAAMALADKTKPAALVIGGGLALIYLLYEIMQFLSGKTKSMLVILFDIGIPCIFAALLVKEYGSILPKFESVLDVIRHVGGDNPVSSIMTMYNSVLSSVTTAIEKAYEAVVSGGAYKAVTDLGGTMLRLADLILTVFFVMGILLLILTGVADLLGLLLMGPFLFAVGVAFGPIMIVGIVTPWTRDYFTKWLQFLVISAGLTGVINVIFTLAASIMDSLRITEYTAGQPTAVSLLILAVLLMTVNSMISQAPSIASALFPGHVGVSKSTGKLPKLPPKKGNNDKKDGNSKDSLAKQTERLTSAVLKKLDEASKKS